MFLNLVTSLACGDAWRFLDLFLFMPIYRILLHLPDCWRFCTPRWAAQRLNRIILVPLLLLAYHIHRAHELIKLTNRCLITPKLTIIPRTIFISSTQLHSCDLRRSSVLFSSLFGCICFLIEANIIARLTLSPADLPFCTVYWPAKRAHPSFEHKAWFLGHQWWMWLHLGDRALSL